MRGFRAVANGAEGYSELSKDGDGQQITWNNPQTGAQYQVVPTRTIQRSDDRYCREYTTTAVINGRTQNTYGQACRQPDGSWQRCNGKDRTAERGANVSLLAGGLGHCRCRVFPRT